jgi:hypothetical protein
MDGKLLGIFEGKALPRLLLAFCLQIALLSAFLLKTTFLLMGKKRASSFCTLFSAGIAALHLSFPALLAAGPAGNLSGAGFFKNQIEPILVENCYQCHSHQAARVRGNLLVDTHAGVLSGGDTGPAIIPGESDKSLLIRAVRYTDPDLQMPPKDKKLTESEINLLVQWVDMGAPWSEGAPPGAVETVRTITEEDRAWWSFQPLTKPAVPQTAKEGWVRNEIDLFILRQLQEANLSPAPEADKQTLIRRAYFDLTGLPPSQEEINAFIQDTSPDAYGKLIDKLLASRHYGERWARHWLDLVRYAESDGYRHDSYRPDAWRYRDYVIRAFNEDKPYNQFIMEQLAGDELAPNDPEVMVATGFLRLWIYEYNQRDVRGQWSAILNDITDVSGDVFLGLGMSCARCHDHKFDPILQKDYYRLQAFFTPILPRDDIPLATASEWLEHQEKAARWESLTKDILESIEQIEKPHREAQGNTVFVKFPEEIQEMILRAPSTRNPLEHQLAELAYRQLLFEFERFHGRIKGEEKERWEALQKELAEFEASKPPPLPGALLVSDVGPFAPPTRIPKGPDEEILPGFLTIFTAEPAKILPLPGAPNSTGRRAALARWLTQPDHPLTSRVMVNRIWHYHFGRGIVGTPSDFGRLGELPSHPELLDWLALEFVERGWSIKEMHRLIMNSAAYRQSSIHPQPELARLKDPENRLLWRANLRRLEGEQIRDAMLWAGGELNLKAGGPSVEPSNPRRTIYTRIFRNQRDPLLDVFDPPDSYISVAARNVTTIPTQSLLLINGQWVLQRARNMAERILEGSSSIPTDAELVSGAYLTAFGRPPEPEEEAAAIDFLKGQAQVLSPVAAPELNVPFPVGESLALAFDGIQPPLSLPSKPSLPAYDFTIESRLLLQSLPAGEEKRTIAGRWDGSKNQPGWALSVTGESSPAGAGALVLELVGVPDEEGQGGYELIASRLKIEPGIPYYAGVTVRIADSSDTGVTFFLQKLAGEGDFETEGVPHQVTAHHHSFLPFTIGGLENDPGRAWSGLIDEVRLSNSALRRDQLLIHGRPSLDSTVGYWRFENHPGLLNDSSPNGHELFLPGLMVVDNADARLAALTDLCHVLLNSNEFLYID